MCVCVCVCVCVRVRVRVRLRLRLRLRLREHQFQRDQSNSKQRFLRREEDYHCTLAGPRSELPSPRQITVSLCSSREVPSTALCSWNAYVRPFPSCNHAHTRSTHNHKTLTASEPGCPARYHRQRQVPAHLRPARLRLRLQAARWRAGRRPRLPFPFCGRLTPGPDLGPGLPKNHGAVGGGLEQHCA